MLKGLRVNKMVIPSEKVSKFLIYGSSNNTNIIFYEFGRYDIYVEKLRELKKLNNKESMYLAKVVTDSPYMIHEFLVNTDLKVIRSFKIGTMTKKGTVPMKFLMTTVKNLCGLLHGKVIRVKSDDKDVRDAFYDALKLVNNEFRYNCKFDYDIYDYTFAAKIIKTDKGKTLIFTYFYDEEMEYPNYNMSV